jgi:N utilization substance protein B
LKTSKDPRHKQREKKVQLLYQYSFRPEMASDPLIAPILEHLPQIDEQIAQAAPTWPVDKLNKIDLAILRLAVWELQLSKDAPPKVVIDEAVELAKKYGSDNSPKFVNGALGALYQPKEKDENR